MIYLVRHGQTDGNKAKVLQGRGSDHPLNEEGRQQAETVRSWFEERQICIDRVYSSPLLRARQTGDIIAGSREMVLEDRLLEMDYGAYEGMDLLNMAEEVKVFFSGFVNNPATPGMEPLPEVVRRMGSFLEMIRPEAGNKTILAVTHAIAMKGALEYLTPESHGGYWGKYIGNCAMYVINLKDGQYTIPEEVGMEAL